MTITHQTTMEYRRRVCRAMNPISRDLRAHLPVEEIGPAACRDDPVGIQKCHTENMAIRVENLLSA